jgi:hypothetical protein
MSRYLRPAAAPLLAVLCVTSSVRADVQACIDAHGTGQDLRRQGKLKDAKAHFIKCAAEDCPTVIRQDCDMFLRDLSKIMPTVVLAAVDEKGNDLADVRVVIDGRPLVGELNGRSIQIDPGPHQFIFLSEDGREMKKTVVVREGDRARPIQVTFAALGQATPEQRPGAAPPPSAPAPAPDRSTGGGSKVAAYVFTGLGLAAVGAFAYFGLTGMREENDLEESCSPNCTDDEVNVIRQSYLFADISLGVAALSFGLGAYFALSSSGSDSGASRPPAGVARHEPDGFVLGWRGRF